MRGISVPRAKNLPTRIKTEYLNSERQPKHEDTVYRMDSNCLWHERRLALLDDELCLTPLHDGLIIEKIPLVRCMHLFLPSPAGLTRITLLTFQHEISHICRLEIDTLNFNLKSDQDEFSFKDHFKICCPAIFSDDGQSTMNDSELVAFNVHTYPESINSGLTFSFRTRSLEECDSWIQLLRTAVAEVKRKSPRVSFFRRYQVI